MPRGYPTLTPEQKQEIITWIKEKGERVALALGINKKRALRVMKLFNLAAPLYGTPLRYLYSHAQIVAWRFQ